ncbi:MAG: HEPN domain-containing protein [Thermoplasmataceae archaeon]
MTAIDEYQIMKSRSEEFLDSAEYQLDKGYFNVAAFSFHQSLELFLKSRLLIHGVEYPRSHSLKSQIEIIANVTEEKCSAAARELLNTYVLELALLEDAYITSIYFSREYSREEIIKLQRVTKEVVKAIGNIC